MRVVAAPDKFRGTVSAADAASAIARAVVSRGGTAIEVPMADGGEGLLDVLGGPDHTTEVTGPLGSPVRAGWRLSGGTAVVEMARASGLVLAGGIEGNRPLDATTAGVGELLRHAVELGARRVIVGMGGSAPKILEIHFCLKRIDLSTGETLEMPTMRKIRDCRRRFNPVREELGIYFGKKRKR